MSAEREKDILRIIYDKRTVTVQELSKMLFISESSIRRDLEHLEKQHLLKRFHGGARLEANGISPLKVPYIVRELTMSEEKERIARKAVSLLKDQDMIFLDSSSSAAFLLPFLNVFRDITVVTNGMETVSHAMDYNFRIISTGGVLHRSARAYYGEETYHSIQNYFANFCFISCAAFDQYGNLCDVSMEENEVRRAMIRQSNHTFLLCSSEKIGLRKFHYCCNIKDIDGVICVEEAKNLLLSEEIQKKMLIA